MLHQLVVVSERTVLSVCAVTKLPPQSPLLSPVDDRSDRSKVALSDRVTAVLDTRQIKDRFLYVRGEVEEVHDLGHTRTSDVTQSGDLGVVQDLSVADQLIEADGERHEACDTRCNPLRDC